MTPWLATALGARKMTSWIDKPSKTQEIRLADVFVIGPLMVWGGMKTRGKNPRLGNMLALMGAATVLYNGRNYLRLRRKK